MILLQYCRISSFDANEEAQYQDQYDTYEPAEWSQLIPGMTLMIPCFTLDSNAEINRDSALSALLFKNERVFNAENGITMDVTASR